MKRNRINIRVSDDLWERLTVEAAAHGSTMTAIIETAIEQYLDLDRVQASEAQLLSRIDSFDLRQDRIETDLRLCTETLAQYVLYWLTQMQPIPEAERDAAHALGKRRYDYFVQQVAKRVGSVEGS